MGVLAVIAVAVTAAVEVVLLRLSPPVLPAAAGAVAVLGILAVRALLGARPEPDRPEQGAGEGVSAALARWRSHTEALVSWSEGTRSEWDRHLRPVLAREFHQGIGQRAAADRRAEAAAGRVHFGDELWQWVDPSRVDLSDRTSPGPGRDVLARIFERLEQL